MPLEIKRVKSEKVYKKTQQIMTELVVVIFTNIPSQYPPWTSTNNGQWNPGSNVDYCMQS
jgi:hypothetical protein